MGLISGDMYKDVQIKFTRNLPVDNTETINVINGLRGLVSDRTLISLLPLYLTLMRKWKRLPHKKQKILICILLAAVQMSNYWVDRVNRQNNINFNRSAAATDKKLAELYKKTGEQIAKRHKKIICKLRRARG